MSAQQQDVITAAEAKAADMERRSLLATFSARYGLEANRMMATLKATVLRPSRNGAEPSNEQVAAFLIVANQHGLNPFAKEIHGFIDNRGGIVAIVGVDGWAKLANEHPQFDGVTFEQDEEKCTATVYRKDRSHPVVVTEYLSECKRPNSEAWTTHPKRMLRWRAMCQGYRVAFSLAGVYDPDEGEQVVAAVNAEIDVTPAKIAPVTMRKIVEGLLAAEAAKDAKALRKAWDALSNDERETIWKQLRSYERTAIKKLQDTAAYKAGDATIEAYSIELMRACKNLDELAHAWTTVQEAYAEQDTEVPGDIETVHQDRKAELGG